MLDGHIVIPERAESSAVSGLPASTA